MDFIFMLTRNDRTVEDADSLVDQACDLGVTHIGFKDVGVPSAAMQELVGKIRRRGGVCYLEVVSTTSEAAIRSLESGAALGVDRILGGTDLRGRTTHPGRPFPLLSVSRHARSVIRPGWRDRRRWSPSIASERGRWGAAASIFSRIGPRRPNRSTWCGRHASAFPGGKLIVAGSVNSPQQIHALSASGVDAFTIGSAVFDGSFSPAKGSLRGQILDILEACDKAPRMAA